MILALILFCMVIAAITYLIHVGGKLKKTDFLEDEVENIHKFSTAVNAVKSDDSLFHDPNNRDSV